jgi:hypothetical protein
MAYAFEGPLLFHHKGYFKFSRKPLLERPSSNFKRYPTSISFLISGMIVVAFYHFFTPFYNINDDCFKVFFAKGVGTNLYPSEFIGYSSVALGFILKRLFLSYPTIPWYGLTLILALFVGTWLFLYTLLREKGPLGKLVLFLIGFITADVTLFASLQFTISSSIAAQGGLFLFTRILQDPSTRSNRGDFVLIFFSFLLSALLRFDELLVTVFCAAPFLLYALRGKYSRLWQPPIKTFIPVTTVALLCVFLSTSFWHEYQPGWHEFDLFDHERVEFRDYRIHFYTPLTKPYFDEAGWSENDFEMFKDWFYMDSVKYDWKNIHRLKQHFSRFGVEGKPASYQSLREIAQTDFGKRLLPVLLCLLLFLPRLEFRWFVFNAVWIMLFILYMAYFWRAPDRVVYQELYFLLCLGIFWSQYLITPSLPTKSFSIWTHKTGLFLLALLTITLIPSLQKDYKNNQLNIGWENQLKADIARLNPKDDQLFVIWDSAFPYELIDAFDSYEIFRKFHIFELAVYQRSPDAIPQLKKFGLVNPLVDMIGKSNVFFICKPEELRMYGRYLSEHHPEKVLASTYFDSHFFRAFQMVPLKEPVPLSRGGNLKYH